ncbi:amidase [Afipia sp. P52-10]|uniref:N-acetylmuramoyl-L-alanine amidase n=1 Tax=Afipia sp. P52-10 TaxID=1429916 RepID=UPI0003DEFBC0|nr:N-acetylmuramoyl-L-alanine amidase [Afipia sp. P52-10]ETR78841.1 amidase [Afipia sp. P52-10]
MSQNSLSQADSTVRRRQALPSPWATSEMKFVPDSSVVADIIPSANYGDRRGGRAPDMIVLHYTGMADAESAIRRLTVAGTEVSAHYIVREDGRIIQCVPETLRAWHAGAATWGTDTDLNSCSIGVEIINGGHDHGLPAYPLRQIAAVIALCKGIMIRRNIPSERVLGHSDVAPGRKQDPGEKFPWQLLADSGVGLFVHPAKIVSGPTLEMGSSGPDVLALQQALADYGYGISASSHYDSSTRDVVAAFQRHFRPARVDGIADPSTIATLTDLIVLRNAGRSKIA